MARVLIAGCGYVGAALAERLAGPHAVWGLRRRDALLPEGVEPIAADLGLAPELAGTLPEGLDCVYYLVSPSGSDDAHYRAAYVQGLANLLTALERQGQRPRRFIFASSTAVYGEQNGEWVDEDTPATSEHYSGRRLLEAEALLDGSVFACTAVRFGGIYGPRRTHLVQSVRTGNAFYRRGHYTNRIHRDDAAGALAHLLELEAPEARYLGVDCEPAEEVVVLRWLAGALGGPDPRAAPRGERSPRGSKRCRNDRILGSGYRFRYPSFREGYGALLSGAP